MDQGQQNVEALLRAGNTVQLPPVGWSMYPTIVYGRDQAVIAPSAGKRLRRGDVILYRREGGILVLHRVCRVRNGLFYTVGDNQTALEGPLRPEQVCGVMTALVRKGKTVPVTALRYRVPAGLWLLLRPVRGPLSRGAAALKRLLRRRGTPVF